MDTVQVYKCLCDTQRLRILNLLNISPLCVCHLQEILGETQVKTSKQLAYMKKLGMVLSERHGQWMVYRLPEEPHPLVIANLQCLQDCSTEMKIFQEDLASRTAILSRIECPTPHSARTSRSAPPCTPHGARTSGSAPPENPSSINSQ